MPSHPTGDAFHLTGHAPDTVAATFTGRPSAAEPEPAVNLHLHIERLVVEGLALDARQGRELQAALQKELLRLLQAGGLPPQFRSGLALAAIEAPPLRLEGESRPAPLGRRIARSIYRGIAP